MAVGEFGGGVPRRSEDVQARCWEDIKGGEDWKSGTGKSYSGAGKDSRGGYRLTRELSGGAGAYRSISAKGTRSFQEGTGKEGSRAEGVLPRVEASP